MSESKEVNQLENIQFSNKKQQKEYAVFPSKQHKMETQIVENNKSNINRDQQITNREQKQQSKKQQNKEQGNQNKKAKKQQKQQVDYDEQIPQKFYDSDLASVNQKDFLSDNEPPKDIVYQRKLLHKQKKLHIYKTIVRVGKGIDKPAPYDQIILRFKNQAQTDKDGVEQARKLQFIEDSEFQTYNLGIKNEQIQRLVTSMKENEIAMFELQQLEVSKKTNIKVLKQKTVYTIEVQNWITVIDIDGNKEVLKYLLRRGQGPHRASKYDQVTFDCSISYRNVEIVNQKHQLLKLQQQIINKMQPIVWKILSTMKKKQQAQVKLSDYNMQALSAIWEKAPQHQNKQKKEELKCNNIIKQQKKQTIQQKSQIQNQQSKEDKTKQQKQNTNQNETNKQQIQYTANLCRYDELFKQYVKKSDQLTKDDTTKNQTTQQTNINKNEGQDKEQKEWLIKIQVKELINIDDIYMDGKIFKKILIKGVSTAKPESSSVIYYALKYLDNNKKVLHEDPCFNSDWWEDYGKLDELGCRKNHMDEYKISKFLKACMKRMKPAQVAEIQCRDMSLFKYGLDYDQLKKLWPAQQQFPPKKLSMIVRVYNFTEGKNCFNMHIDQKVQESRRKKKAAVQLLNDGNYKKAFKRFQNIVSFYGSGDITQDAYDQKISALMNSILCLMKQSKYSEMVPLCNIVLEKPRHGFNQDKMKLKAQGIKVEGNVKNVDGEEMDPRQAADLYQNPKILDKCLYRKGLALLKTGESQHTIQCLDKIADQSEQVKKLRAQAQKHLQDYQEKSKKIFKNMFG